MRNEKVQKLTLTALMAALSYVIFTFLQIKVTLPGGSATSFHLGNPLSTFNPVKTVNDLLRDQHQAVVGGVHHEGGCCGKH